MYGIGSMANSAWSVPGDVREFEERCVHRLLVNELLGSMQQDLARAAVRLKRLLIDEVLDLGIRAVGEEASRGHEGDSRGHVQLEQRPLESLPLDLPFPERGDKNEAIAPFAVAVVSRGQLWIQAT
jgi:hypothetical protein